VSGSVVFMYVACLFLCVVGRTLFIVFVCTICFGAAGKYSVVGIIIGVVSLCNAIFNCFVSCYLLMLVCSSFTDYLIVVVDYASFLYVLVFWLLLCLCFCLPRSYTHTLRFVQNK